ncbi:MAG TPA: SRPBCC domain-containing protein [Solirubrobacteraceae bacterium]|nr:SRPBCC domain-containing protein [Solirubrobacteraceae bacterium]
MTDRIERELELPAPSDEVWEALTDPERLAGWLADEVSFDLRPGGDASFREGDIVRRGWVEEVSPPDTEGDGRLAFWWASDDEPATRVELTLAPAPGGTRLRVVETRPLELVDAIASPLFGSGSASFDPQARALVATG